MKKKKCDVTALKAHFPEDFQPWTSQGESLLAKYGCDLVNITNKTGITEYLIGNKSSPSRDTSVFEAVGFIPTTMAYDEEKDAYTTIFKSATSYKKKKVVVVGSNGSGAVLPANDVNNVAKSIKDIANED